MMFFQTALSVLMLAAVFWVLMFLLPKARRDHDRFAIVCSVLTALVALVGWLFLGVGAR